eukprot:363423-Chlamydomonas_euryale.AAC.3
MEHGAAIFKQQGQIVHECVHAQPDQATYNCPGQAAASQAWTPCIDHPLYVLLFVPSLNRPAVKRAKQDFCTIFFPSLGTVVARTGAAAFLSTASRACQQASQLSFGGGFAFSALDHAHALGWPASTPGDVWGPAW